MHIQTTQGKCVWKGIHYVPFLGALWIVCREPENQPNICLYVTNPLAIVDTAKTQILPTTSVYSARFKYAQLEIKEI